MSILAQVDVVFMLAVEIFGRAFLVLAFFATLILQ